MSKHVLVLGDSFTFGHGCSDRVFYYDRETKTYKGERLDDKPPSQYCWSNLLQQEFPSLTVHNHSYVGKSNQGMLYNFVEWFEFHPRERLSLVIFNGTIADRVELPMIHDNSKTGSWGVSWADSLPDKHPDEPEELTKAKQIYAKYLYNKRIGDQLAFSALMAAFTLARSQTIRILWSMPAFGFNDERLLEFLEPMSEFEVPALWGYDFSNNKDKDFNKNFLCYDGHTNELGHKMYYQNEIRFKIKGMLGV